MVDLCPLQTWKPLSYISWTLIIMHIHIFWTLFSFSCPPSGPLPFGPGSLLYGGVHPDRHTPPHLCVQHHAARPHPPRLTACPAGGGGGRPRRLPAPESRGRGKALDPEPQQTWQSDHLRIKLVCPTTWYSWKVDENKPTNPWPDAVHSLLTNHKCTPGC